jgi:hypothetical protein
VSEPKVMKFRKAMKAELKPEFQKWFLKVIKS